MNQQQIDWILNLLLMAKVKQNNDAPCSSQMTWSEAIVLLSKYASEGAVTDIECLDELNAAKEIIGEITRGNFSENI